MASTDFSRLLENRGYDLHGPLYELSDIQSTLRSYADITLNGLLVCFHYGIYLIH
ncbi:hypothetical protein BC830DRAFT_1108535 [Chytriomyces sp. MP71]|nr:hypothetical protein BC830DRAFT_1108535 [Chytriomyces sp. MP71]